MAPREPLAEDRINDVDKNRDVDGPCDRAEDFSLFGSNAATKFVIDEQENRAQECNNSDTSPCKEEEELVHLRSRIRRLLALKCPSSQQRPSPRLSDDKQHGEDKDRALADLMTYVTDACGARMDDVAPQKDAHGGRGLFATRDIQRNGHVLAVLPRNLRLGQRRAILEFGGLPSWTPDLTATSLLVLHWYASSLEPNRNVGSRLRSDEEKKEEGEYSNSPDSERMGSYESFGSLYAQSLPMLPCEFHNAVMMSEEELQKWSHRPEYQQEMHRVRARADCCVQYIQEVLLEDNSEGCESRNSTVNRDSAIYWAIAMVLSRTHAFGSRQGGRWMTPVLDLANHSPNANAYLEGDSQGHLLLKSHRPIACGEEVTLDYQVAHDPELVATYGFSLLGVTSSPP
mmetsp:Transcript_17871/g.33229  ORF Transcript_17871/g.33229 Transcript_17871/m.33229 type:complete len:400 (-) Transcript_17871:157-1356(-)